MAVVYFMESSFVPMVTAYDDRWNPRTVFMISPAISKTAILALII